MKDNRETDYAVSRYSKPRRWESQTSKGIKTGKTHQSPYVAESCHKDLVPHLVTVSFATVFLVPHVVGTQEIRVEWMNKWLPERPSWGLTIENKMGPN